VVDEQLPNPGHDETIVPVKPGLKGPKPVVSKVGNEKAISTPTLVITLGALALLVVIVFFILPRWVEKQEPLQPLVDIVVPEVPDQSEEPSFTPEELETLRQEAEALLAQLLTQQGQLDRQSAVEWGGEDFERYEILARDGDDAYLSNAFYDAIPAYSKALEIGEILLSRSVDLIAATLSAGAEALDAGNATVALEQFELVLSIEGENSVARAGLIRAQQLPEVLALMQTGEEFRRTNDYEAAAKSYGEALALDNLWQPARTALEAVNSIILDRRFDTLMSLGLGALMEGAYSDAYDVFTQALAVRPDSPDALNSRIQAEQGQQLDEIALIEARALAFESRELWEMGVRLYTEILETDNTLAFAQQGLLRARDRADLDLKLVNLIENPNLLFSDQVLRDAEMLLVEASAIQQAGFRLTSQINDLGLLVQIASAPVPVEIYSDEETEVTVYRVGSLGKFLFKQLALRPGNYTVVGSRIGYVDVRHELQVLPERDVSPIRVECVESIR
jgi:hypothetical protein